MLIIVRATKEKIVLYPNWLFKAIREFEAYPRWYGFAWGPWEADFKVAMPIPLNFFVNWARTLWHWMRTRLIWRQTDIDKVWRRGYGYGRYGPPFEGQMDLKCRDCGGYNIYEEEEETDAVRE